MPTMTDALLSNAGALATNSTAYIANIVQSGQYGYGNHIPLIDGATPLVLRPIVPVVVSAPSMLENVTGAIDILKALIERHTTRIEGIDLTYTVEAATVPAGADGQELSVPTNARRAGVNPAFSMPEITGGLVWNFWKLYQNLMKDADTQASSLAGVVAATTYITPHVMSSFSFDTAYLQYDTTMRAQNMLDSYFIVASWPTDIGGFGAVKNVGQSEHPERTITCTGVVQHNDNTRQVGVKLATYLDLARVNYNVAAPAVTDIDAALKGMGIDVEETIFDANFGLVSSTTGTIATPETARATTS